MILSLIFVSCILESLSLELTNPKSFFDKCFENINNQSCTTYRCFSQRQMEDLRLMDRMVCTSDSECLSTTTGFICREYSHGAKFCDCPFGQAYNALSCKCQFAELCPKFNNTSGPTQKNSCHKGLKCADDLCSCRKPLTEVLFEPHGRFCVSPRLNTVPNSSSSSPNIVLICICALILIIVVSGVLLQIIRKNVTCHKGDYKCEEMEVDRREDGENHVAAWNLPSLDYLTEEEAMKYIKKERRSSPDGGSLPECEQSHVNAGYISDNN